MKSEKRVHEPGGSWVAERLDSLASGAQFSCREPKEHTVRTGDRLKLAEVLALPSAGLDKLRPLLGLASYL